MIDFENVLNFLKIKNLKHFFKIALGVTHVGEYKKRALPFFYALELSDNSRNSHNSEFSENFRNLTDTITTILKIL